MRRREFVSLAAVAGVAVVAGCSGGDGKAEDGDGSGTDGGDGDESDGGTDVETVESFVQEGTVDGVTYVIEVHGDDMHYYEEGGGTEMYVVDDVGYVLFEGECMTMPDDGREDPPQDPEYEANALEEYEDVTPDGTETIDGVEVEVYAVEVDSVEATYYLTEEGYIRRFESEGQTVDFHSWNEVDPIEPPDVDCEELTVPGGDWSG